MTIFTWRPLPGVTDPNSAPLDGTGIPTSDIPCIQTPLKLGILTVTLHQGVGFSIPDEHKRLCESERDGGPLPYAVLDYDKSQAVAQSILGTTENPSWVTRKTQTSHRFDVARISELTLYIYLRTSGSKDEDVLLGVTKFIPSINGNQKGAEWMNIQEGTGKIYVGDEYGEGSILNVGDNMELSHSAYLDSFERGNAIGEGKHGKVVQYTRKDTQRLYACKFIPIGDVSIIQASNDSRSQINTSLIATIKLVFQMSGYWHVFQPFISGGHVFYYLQRDLCFDVTRSTYYLGEILCAFEYLHDHGYDFVELKPRNVLLDYWGHVVICDFGLCGLLDKATEQIVAGALEFPAPEMILRQNVIMTIDWWTLGIFLFEMLTGLPPFYDEDPNEKYRRILSEPLQFPDSLTLPSKDILNKLLHRSPEQRLGAKGAYEIKDHHFFSGLDWQKLLQRGYKPAFKPGNISMEFQEDKVEPFPMLREVFVRSNTASTQNMECRPEVSSTERNLTSAKEHSELSFESHNVNVAQKIVFGDETNTFIASTDDDSIRPSDGQGELIAEVVDVGKTFLPSNSTHDVNSPQSISVFRAAQEDDVESRTDLQRIMVAGKTAATLLQVTESINTATSGSLFNHDHPLEHRPSQNQLEDALEAALKSGNRQIILTLLEYKMDLNTQRYYFKHGTPLRWVIDLEDL